MTNATFDCPECGNELSIGSFVTTVLCYKCQNDVEVPNDAYF